MRYVSLGGTGLKVSSLCFGSLTIGPLQARLPLAQGAELIHRALELGINFIDTAESYDTYPYIRKALKNAPGPVYVATKSYAYTGKGMRESLIRAQEALDREVIDVFLLHEQENSLTIEGHREALDYLREAKGQGLVRAVGISTHTVDAVRAAALLPEIDVIHPLLNLEGIGIRGGTVEEMIGAVREAEGKGKGIYAMKPLGGGHLHRMAPEALRFVLSIPWVHSVAVGMQSWSEVEYNIALVEGNSPDPVYETLLAGQQRRLHIEDWCQGCGKCVLRCTYGALRLDGGKAVAGKECILCGYCGTVCPEFCIKII
ncbi:MAG: aldo/keto reductase [Bacillota bacterium]